MQAYDLSRKSEPAGQTQRAPSLVAGIIGKLVAAAKIGTVSGQAGAAGQLIQHSRRMDALAFHTATESMI